MNRVFVAVGLLVLIIIGSFFTINYTQHHWRHLILLTDKIEVAVIQEDNTQAMSLIQTVSHEFSNCTAVFSLFVHHNTLIDIEKMIATLPYHLDNTTAFLEELTLFRMLLYKQLELEYPVWTNILRA